MSDGRVNGSPSAEDPTLEEELLRSRKKVWKGDSVTAGGRAHVPQVEDWMEDDAEAETREGQSEPQNGQKMSYKQACANEGGDGIGEDEEVDRWWLNEEWQEKIRVERMAKGSNIIMPPEYKSLVTRKWRFAMIVTVLG